MKAITVVLTLSLCLCVAPWANAESEAKESKMKVVTMDEFKQIYMRPENRTGGYTKEAWKKNYESTKAQGFKFKIKYPESPSHNRMQIVTDFAAKEHRMFFLTEEEEEALYGGY